MKLKLLIALTALLINSSCFCSLEDTNPYCDKKTIKLMKQVNKHLNAKHGYKINEQSATAIAGLCDLERKPSSMATKKTIKKILL